MNLSDQSSNGITRRNFMKKTALTVGAVTLLARGTGFAIQSRPPPSCTNTICDGYDPTFADVYCDNPSSVGQAKTFFTVGTCKCKKGLQDYTTPAWQTAADPGEDILYGYPGAKPTLQHTAAHHIGTHAGH